MSSHDSNEELSPMGRWERQRQEGVMYFIITRGFLGFTLPGSLLYSFITSRRFGVDFWHLFPRAFSLFLFPSILFCLFIWFVMERKYKNSPQGKEEGKS